LLDLSAHHPCCLFLACYLAHPISSLTSPLVRGKMELSQLALVKAYTVEKRDRIQH
jgi:hypothetical protein